MVYEITEILFTVSIIIYAILSHFILKRYGIRIADLEEAIEKIKQGEGENDYM